MTSEAVTFEALGLNANILRALGDCGYTIPTPIQAQAIPIVLMGRDLVGLAQTGTGKTAGFTLPMIEILSVGRAKARMPRSLILTPTRELAAQIAENFDTYGKYHKLTKALLVGGSSMDAQINALERGVDVLIATPGRLMDLFERGRILLTDIKILVIDEADRMLDMGFIPDIEKIVSKLPRIRQTLLFSATMPAEIRKLTLKFQSNPKEVSVAPPSSTADRVEQFILRVSSARAKERALADLIESEDVQHAFIFCNRKRDVDVLARWMEKQGYNAKPLHGDMDQKHRTLTLQAFKERKIKLLVCSDVAARGLDVDDLSHVFNYDVPFNAEDYVHRIGRTARAGKTGRAWTLATSADDENIGAIEKLIKKKIEVRNAGGANGGAAAKPERQEENRGGRDEGPRKDDRPRHSSERGPKPAAREHSSREPRNDRPAPQKRQPEERKERDNRDRNDRDGGGTGFGDSIPGFFGKSGK